jgi:hypothetical protein
MFDYIKKIWFVCKEYFKCFSILSSYKCSLCDYETRKKEDFESHFYVKHKDMIEEYL